jgi:hypothetical protein
MADHEHRSAKSAAVVYNAANQRFEMDIDGQLSVLEYIFKNHRLFLTHKPKNPNSLLAKPQFGNFFWGVLPG